MDEANKRTRDSGAGDVGGRRSVAGEVEHVIGLAGREREGARRGVLPEVVGASSSLNSARRVARGERLKRGRDVNIDIGGRRSGVDEAHAVGGKGLAGAEVDVGEAGEIASGVKRRKLRVDLASSNGNREVGHERARGHIANLYVIGAGGEGEEARSRAEGDGRDERGAGTSRTAGALASKLRIGVAKLEAAADGVAAGIGLSANAEEALFAAARCIADLVGAEGGAARGGNAGPDVDAAAAEEGLAGLIRGALANREGVASRAAEARTVPRGEVEGREAGKPVGAVSVAVGAVARSNADVVRAEQTGRAGVGVRRRRRNVVTKLILDGRAARNAEARAMTDREAGARAAAGSLVEDVGVAITRGAGARQAARARCANVEAVGVQRAIFRARVIGRIGVAELTADSRTTRGIRNADKLVGLLSRRVRALLTVCSAGVGEQLLHADAILTDEASAELRLAVDGPSTRNRAARIGRVGRVELDAVGSRIDRTGILRRVGTRIGIRVLHCIVAAANQGSQEQPACQHLHPRIANDLHVLQLLPLRKSQRSFVRSHPVLRQKDLPSIRFQRGHLGGARQCVKLRP